MKLIGKRERKFDKRRKEKEMYMEMAGELADEVERLKKEKDEVVQELGKVNEEKRELEKAREKGLQKEGSDRGVATGKASEVSEGWNGIESVRRWEKE